MRIYCEGCGYTFSSDAPEGACPMCGMDYSAKKTPSIGSITSVPRSAQTALPLYSNAREFVNDKIDAGADLFEKVINGVLEITVQSNKEGAWSGSGYLISKKGYAITNAHVVAEQRNGKPCQSITVNICGQKTKAFVVALGDDKAGNGKGVDLALIKLYGVPVNAVALNFADINDIHTGERVFVLGNSLGDGTCITSGIVSDKRRVLGGKTLLMTDCAINGGNSGGPIFNADAKVIGTICSERIKTDGHATKGMNYAVPVDLVLDFIKEQKNISL